MPDAAPEGSADALSQWHIDKIYKDKLVQSKYINIVDIGGELFHISPLL